MARGQNVRIVEGSVGITGSNGEQDLRGLAADKPAATAVVTGTTYWSVDTGETEVSDGTSWVAF